MTYRTLRKNHNPATFNGAIVGYNINLHSDFRINHVPFEPPVSSGDGAIGDRVWEDSFDTGVVGVQDPGEPGLNGVRVTLFDGSMNEIASMLTSGDGNCLFENLPAGTYTVKVNPDDVLGLFPTFDADGISSADQATVSLGAGEVDLGVDFGYGLGR